MIWIILSFLLLLQFGLYGAYAAAILAVVIGVIAAVQRRWYPPNLWLNWIVGIWFLVSILGYAFNYSLDGEALVRLFAFSWILILYSLTFIFERARPNEEDLWHSGFLFFGFGIWQIGLFFLPRPLDLSILGLEGQSIDLLSEVSQANAVFFAFVMGYCLTQVRFFNRSKWLLLAATGCLGSALIVADQSSSIAAALVALFFMSSIFSLRLWLFVIMPLVALVLYEEAGKILLLLHQFDVTNIVASVRGVGLFGQGFGSATNVNVEILRVFVETGWIGVICFVLIQGYFLRLGLLTWKSSSDRNAFLKGLSLGLLGADLTLVGLSIFGLSMSNPFNLAVSALVWAAQLWLGYETRILRRPIA